MGLSAQHHHDGLNPLVIVALVLWSIADLPLFIAYKLGHPLAYYRIRGNATCP